MIKGSGIYDVLSTLIPLYVATLLGYGSVKWWKLFSPEQCSGINKFVATFAIPFLTFHFISSNNIYDLNFRFIAADSLHKVIVLVLLVVFNYSKYGDLDWSITCYSISALPNSLLIGVPLLKAMYGDFSTSLMVQIVVSQSVVWLVLLLILLEYRKAKVEQSSNVASSDDLEKQHSVPLSRDGSSKVTRSESDDSVIEHTVSSPSGRQEKDNGDTNQVSVITKILTTVGKKLAQNPTIYGSVLGLIWSLISFRWKIHLPKIIEGCVTILSSTGLGMAMFSIGLFISLQPKIITCGKKEAAISMAIRFLVSPAIIAATSLVIGLRGDLLRVAIVQGALPQSVSTFVFAKEYNCHAGILCTAVIFGMAAAIPITILYYVLLGLK